MVLDGFFDFNVDHILQVLLAVGLGALIGFERGLKQRPAGFRTHMLVSMGAAIFTIVSLSIDADPSRIAAGVVAGIGFLGAGSIIAHKGHVKGITSAATLWVVAAIGLAVGLGEYLLSIIGAILVFGILRLSYFEKKFVDKSDDNWI